jgi:hypothetical protein
MEARDSVVGVGSVVQAESSNNGPGVGWGSGRNEYQESSGK